MDREKELLKEVKNSYSWKGLYGSHLSKLRRGGVLYMIEGIWNGYTSSQSRVCWRIITGKKERAEACQKLGVVWFTDGTKMTIHVKEIKDKSQMLPLKESYTKLVDDCIRAGVDSVHELNKKEKEVSTNNGITDIFKEVAEHFKLAKPEAHND